MALVLAGRCGCTRTVRCSGHGRDALCSSPLMGEDSEPVLSGAEWMRVLRPTVGKGLAHGCIWRLSSAPLIPSGHSGQALAFSRRGEKGLLRQVPATGGMLMKASVAPALGGSPLWMTDGLKEHPPHLPNEAVVL